MRRLAVEMNIPFVTTISGAKMEVAAIIEAKKGSLTPIKLQVNYQTLKSTNKNNIAIDSSTHLGQA